VHTEFEARCFRKLVSILPTTSQRTTRLSGRARLPLPAPCLRLRVSGRHPVFRAARRGPGSRHGSVASLPKTEERDRHAARQLGRATDRRGLETQTRSYRGISSGPATRVPASEASCTSCSWITGAPGRTERQQQVLCSLVRIDGCCFGFLATMEIVRCRFRSLRSTVSLDR
jgi:hypothetical protein